MPATIVKFPGQPPTYQASVLCVLCSWGATQTGGNAIESAIFLRALLLQHYADRHPGTPPKDLP
jgi:hypothetical protein